MNNILEPGMFFFLFSLTAGVRGRAGSLLGFVWGSPEAQVPSTWAIGELLPPTWGGRGGSHTWSVQSCWEGLIFPLSSLATVGNSVRPNSN